MSPERRIVAEKAYGQVRLMRLRFRAGTCGRNASTRLNARAQPADPESCRVFGGRRGRIRNSLSSLDTVGQLQEGLARFAAQAGPNTLQKSVIPGAGPGDGLLIRVS